MANQTINGVTRNYDDAAISGLLNGEDITVNNGGSLIVNSDMRWGQQAAVLGNLTIDVTTGGSARFDGREVWWVPFDAATGTVPALGTYSDLRDATNANRLTRGGVVVAEFLGVFSALGVAPTTSGSAFPATGFLKLRWVAEGVTFADNDVLTHPVSGATITLSGPGQRGWLHIVGEHTTLITVPRLGLFECFGDWFELGTTNGSTGQTLQHFVADYCPAVQVETAPGSGVYEWWTSAGTTRWGQNNRVAQGANGRHINCTAAGVIQFALRGAVNNGQLPPSGCRVRVPNIHVSGSTSAIWTNNVYTATIADRWEFATTGAGAVVIDRACGAWYLNFSQAYSVSITDSAVMDGLVISECATAPTLTRVAVGIAITVDLAPFTITSCFAGANITDCVVAKYESEVNDDGVTITDCDGISISGGKFATFGDNTAATLTRGASTAYALTMTRVTNSTITDLALIGAGANISSCSNLLFNNTQYADAIENRTTSSTQGGYAFAIQSGSSLITVDGFSTFADLANQHPYLGIVSIQQSYDCVVQNIGSYSSPFNCGSSNQTGVLVNFGGNGADHVIRRCYGINLRTGIVATVNSDTRCQLIDVRGDYADVINLAGLNMSARGLSGAQPTTGQTAVYGTLFFDFFDTTTLGYIVFLSNEPTLISGSKLTLSAGSPRFTSAGAVQLLTVGDEVIWEIDYFVRGHTGFTGVVNVSGTNVTAAAPNWGNHYLSYQIDTGLGFSGWKDLTVANLTSETISPTTGFRLRMRARCITQATNNQIINIRVQTSTSSSAQDFQYPLPGIPVTLVNLQPNSEVRAYIGTDPSTATELAGVENSGTSFEFTHTSTGQQGYIVVAALGYQNIQIPITYSGSAQTIPVQQQVDRQYSNIA